MLQELSDESRKIRLKMNITKTKVMVVDNTLTNVNNVLIENVKGYIIPGMYNSHNTTSYRKSEMYVKNIYCHPIANVYMCVSS